LLHPVGTVNASTVRPEPFFLFEHSHKVLDGPYLVRDATRDNWRCAENILLDLWPSCGYTYNLMGRPKKPQQERRDKPLRIRLTEAERSFINGAAQTYSLDASAWARSLLLREARKVAERS
jgi:hypothetical protein